MVQVPRDWNAHYADPANLTPTLDPLLVQFADRLSPGRALDLACGHGRHARYLAELGWHVIAVDSSPAAIARVGPPIDARVADLEKHEFQIEPNGYDLIVDILYLQRDLFAPIREGLRPGGIFLGAILLASPERNIAFTLKPGELRAEFACWKIPFYSEAGGVARIAARRA